MIKKINNTTKTDQFTKPFSEMKNIKLCLQFINKYLNQSNVLKKCVYYKELFHTVN